MELSKAGCKNRSTFTGFITQSPSRAVVTYVLFLSAL